MTLGGKLYYEWKRQRIIDSLIKENRYIPIGLLKILRSKKVCKICREPFDKKNKDLKLTIDHIIPLALGGESIESNLRSVHKNCHKKADKKKFEEYNATRKNKPDKQ